MTSRHPNDEDTPTVRKLRCVKCGDVHSVDVTDIIDEGYRLAIADAHMDWVAKYGRPNPEVKAALDQLWWERMEHEETREALAAEREKNKGNQTGAAIDNE